MSSMRTRLVPAPGTAGYSRWVRWWVIAIIMSWPAGVPDMEAVVNLMRRMPRSAPVPLSAAVW